MFTIQKRIQMPGHSPLIFDMEFYCTELNNDGEAFDLASMKSELHKWWVDESAPRRTQEEACLGAWATATDQLVKMKISNRVRCVSVSVDTSGQKVTLRPTEETWSRLDG